MHQIGKRHRPDEVGVSAAVPFDSSGTTSEKAETAITPFPASLRSSQGIHQQEEGHGPDEVGVSGSVPSDSSGTTAGRGCLGMDTVLDRDAASMPGMGCRAWDAAMSCWGFEDFGKGRAACSGPCSKSHVMLIVILAPVVPKNSLQHSPTRSQATRHVLLSHAAGTGHCSSRARQSGVLTV